MARPNAFFPELIPTISRLRWARRLRGLTQTGSPGRLLSVVNQRVRDGPLSSCVRKEQEDIPVLRTSRFRLCTGVSYGKL